MLKKIIRIILKVFKSEGIYFIGSTDKLPEPLKRDEEERLVLLNMDGDNDAKSKLIEHNLRLVVFLSKKYENTGIDLEDLVSIGTIGLIKGVNTYKLDKNIKLATYASRCIENEILMYLRKTSKLKSEVSIDEPLNTDGDGNELLLSDVLGNDEDGVFKDLEDEIDRTLIKESIERLNKRERKIMELRFGFATGKEETQKEVADMLGISQSYISRLEKKIIGRMRKEMKAKI